MWTWKVSRSTATTAKLGKTKKCSLFWSGGGCVNGSFPPEISSCVSHLMFSHCWARLRWCVWYMYHSSIGVSFPFHYEKKTRKKKIVFSLSIRTSTWPVTDINALINYSSHPTMPATTTEMPTFFNLHATTGQRPTRTTSRCLPGEFRLAMEFI